MSSPALQRFSLYQINVETSSTTVYAVPDPMSSQARQR